MRQVATQLVKESASDKGFEILQMMLLLLLQQRPPHHMPRGCAVAPMIRPDVADELAIPPGGASSELTAV